MRLGRPPVQAEASIVAAESCGADLVLVGTDRGEVAVAGVADALIHTKNDSRVLSILAVDSRTALVFSERNNGSIGSATAYTVPTLEAVAGLSLHDVCGGVLLGERVAVFSSGAIRILQFTSDLPPKVSVQRSIELKGVVKGCGCDTDRAIVLVATHTEYQLVNVKTAAKIPLFPIHPELEPMMAAFGTDFLVVQGTGQTEPSMGLVVDSHGEVARSGVVIQWDSYPKSLATSGDYIFAVVQDSSRTLVVHYVDPVSNSVREVDMSNLKSPEAVFQLTFPTYILDNDLFDRLGDKALSHTKAEIAIVLGDGSIVLWGAPSRLKSIEKAVLDGTLTQITPDPSTAGSEQGVAELEYLSLLLVLHNLDNAQYDHALKAWHEGPQIAFELVLFVYGDDNIAEPQMYPGLKPLLLRLHQKGIEGELDNVFLRLFLRAEIKRHRRDPSTAYTTAKLLELRYAKILNEHELTRFLLERDLKARNEILAWLEDMRFYSVLVDYYTVSNWQVALAKLSLKIVRDADSSTAQVQQAAQALVDYALRTSKTETSDDLNIWDLLMELISNPRIKPKLSLDLLTHPSFESAFEPGEVLRTLKERTSSGEAWRIYLKHLVYTKGLFTDDLATILIADIIELMTTASGESAACSAVSRSYAAFHELLWPKPLYRDYVKRWAKDAKNGYPRELMDLQTELWHLLDQRASLSDQIELPSIMSTFETRLPNMYMERSMIFRELGLHDQSLEMLCNNITDYRAVIDYESATVTSGNEGENAIENENADENAENDTRRDLVRLAFKRLLASDARDKNAVIHDFMAERGHWLDISAVFSQLSESTPFSVIADYAIRNVRHHQALEQRARMVLALTKADALRYQSWTE